MSDDQVLTGSGTRTRRALFAGVGAVGAAVALAACGSDGSGTGSSGSTGGGDAGSGNPDSAGPLARTTDIPVGGGAVFASSGVVITQPEPGQFKGFDPICTHQGCPLSSVDGGTINCTCHGSRFSIADGSVKQGPATRPLAPRNLKVTGDQIALA